MRLIDADALKKEFSEGAFTSRGVREIIDNAPTVTPDMAQVLAYESGKSSDRPKGEWEIVDAEGGKIWNCVCTECGHDPQEYIGGTEDWWLRKPLPNFCPNCGERIVNVRGDYE